jgi:uncharacterized protein (TIGR00661 family)
MDKKPIRVLFAVQGEGRGHLTQSISLQNILLEQGYDIAGVLLGSSRMRQIPDFYFQKIKSEITRFESPNFLPDKKGKGIRVFPSIFYTLWNLPTFWRNMKMIDRKIKELKPDVLINFYDPLIGLYYMLFRPKTPMICIAHQYIFHHPQFRFPAKGFFWEQVSLRNFTDLTAARAKCRLALSLYPLPDYPKKKINVIPPLLRKEVYEQPVTSGNYILVYLLNAGYMEEITRWSDAHPDVPLHCFTDKKEVKDSWQYSPSLTFHQLNDRRFVELMAGCKAFASTAGFESICEAMYFGKPVLMVPVAGHFEQFSNARDAARAGAGIYDSVFNLDKLIDYLPKHQYNSAYKDWADSSQALILKHLQDTVG